MKDHIPAHTPPKDPDRSHPGGALTTTESPTGGSRAPSKRVSLVSQHPRGTFHGAEARDRPKMTTHARKLFERTRISAPTHEGKQQQKVQGVTPAALISGSCLLDSTPEVLTTVLKPGITHEGPQTRAHSSKDPNCLRIVPPWRGVNNNRKSKGWLPRPYQAGSVGLPAPPSPPRGTSHCAEARSAPPGPKYFRSLLKGT